MRIINIFSFILSVLAFSTSLANTELAANNDPFTHYKLYSFKSQSSNSLWR